MLHKIFKTISTVLCLGLISSVSYSKDIDRADVAIRSILGLSSPSGAVVLKEECLVEYSAIKVDDTLSSIYIKVRSLKDAQRVFSFYIEKYNPINIFDDGSIQASYQTGDDCETEGCSYYYTVIFRISKAQLLIEEMFEHSKLQLKCSI
jgi:hypothetical protein